MPAAALLITVRLLDRRYHGHGDWPPSPFRLLQALVAGAYGGRWCAERAAQKDAAFAWLERLDPPHIAVPAKLLTGRSTRYYVPNNDLDAVGGDPLRVSEIPVEKVMRPVYFAENAPILYAWPFDDGESHAGLLCILAERLYRLGLGVDPAFAVAEILNWHAAEQRLREHGGAVARPATTVGGGDLVPCPRAGSLASLQARHGASAKRFTASREGKAVTTLFRQPPKPLSRGIAYDRPPQRFLFDLRPVDRGRPFQPIAQAWAFEVAKAVRDRAAERLSRHIPSARVAEVERFVLGRGAGEPDKLRRIRIIPLPSIGTEHTDPAIRRVLIEVPPDCPVPAPDVLWAVSGQSICDRIDLETGEIAEGPVLVPAENGDMLRSYGIEASATRWRTVTPAALPERRPAGQIGGEARAAAEARAAVAVAKALRHAGVDPSGVAVHVQTEPLHRKGLRADAFEQPDRFARGALRHVEVSFPRAVRGPLVIGDGRWLGLGLMAPVRDDPPMLHVFSIEGDRAPLDQSEIIARALRRAVMSRVQRQLGRGEKLPTFFTGHDPGGAPTRSGKHEHLFFLADDADGDGYVDRVAIIAPRLADRSIAADHRRELGVLDAAVADMAVPRAGIAGAPRLVPTTPADDDPVFGRAASWLSRTEYRPTRHPRNCRDTAGAVHRDVLLECDRRGLPRPEVEIVAIETGQRGGISSRLRLRFAMPIAGALLLGSGSHFGHGLFCAEPDEPLDSDLMTT